MTTSEDEAEYECIKCKRICSEFEIGMFLSDDPICDNCVDKMDAMAEQLETRECEECV
jgi:hypothetical protein